MSTMLEIIKELNDATYFYDKGEPIMTDSQWDALYYKLVEMERQAGYSYPDSPTQSITYEVVNELKKVEHNHKMLSLEKTKDTSEILSFIGNHDYIAMCKMDGLTCSLHYLNGKLVGAETRGNGEIGEDVLHNAQVINSIPNYINYHEELVIDGEIICTAENFKEFKKEYKNARNFAAGSIRLLDSRECKKRNLTFVAWDVIKGLDTHITNFNTKTKQYDEKSFYPDGENTRLSAKLYDLAKLGFTIVPHEINFKLEEMDLRLIDKHIDYLKAEAERFGYPIDGLVFKYNNIKESQSCGATAHHFKNAMAYKFFDETYPTRLTGIEWSMGRTGVLTPVAIFEPVEIDGCTVTRASLHNLSVMDELLGTTVKGQELEIYKANQIIPQVYSAKKYPEAKDDYYMISVCPYCGESLIVTTSDTGVQNLVCENPQCSGKIINRLDHFCSKKGLDIKGLSTATLEKLLDWGWIEKLSDIFTLYTHRNEWIKKEGFGAKSVDNILDAIEKAKECSLASFISAIGIPLIGLQYAKELVKYIDNYEDLIEKCKNKYDFSQIPSFGEIRSSELLNFNFTETNNIYKFLKITKDFQNDMNNKLENQIFCITGKLNSFKNRDLLKDEIEKYGGKATDSISAKTTYLINNDINSTSAKNKKAKELGIPIITEQEFLDLIK